MNNDTQPLVEPAPDAFPLHYRSPYIPGNQVNDPRPLMAEPSEAYYEEAQKALHDAMNSPLAQALKQRYQEAQQHKHGPFTFLLNQNHNALRGCQTCGAAWVGAMAGHEDNLLWHPVRELEEEE